MVLYTNKKGVISLESIESLSNPVEALSTGKMLIKTWVHTLPEGERLEYGRSFVYYLVKSYWNIYYQNDSRFDLPDFGYKFKTKILDDTILALAESLGKTSSKLSLIDANYHIGSIYSALIPDDIRSEKGIYFTPPILTHRLLNLVEEQGVNWQNATVLDPACGGGAFLAPVAIRLISGLEGDIDAETVLQIIERNLKGYEQDFFSAWLSQVFVEIAVCKYCLVANRRLRQLVEICNTLENDSQEWFDVIIGNPPYGKTKLNDSLRLKYKESLYGHANLYGLFTHIALKRVKKGGVIAYVTPTSFLAGEYFKNLRSFLLRLSNPKVFDFVTFRKGVFDDVLQETMLAVYKAEENTDLVEVNQIHPDQNERLEVVSYGKYNMPSDTSSVWILPRTDQQAKLIKAAEKMNCTLKDWGYEVITGQLVWNRHKKQLTNKPVKSSFPLIWAEAISSEGEFKWKAEKPNHTLYFNYLEGQDHLLVNYPCILLQRTTSKEQDRRLVAAMLPQSFIATHKAAVIENHINIIKPITGVPKVSIELLVAFLNSQVADIAFRCISGSVAVSVYELGSMPLPSHKVINKLQKLIEANSEKQSLEAAFLKLYQLK